jgi:hypothetical protein
LTAFFCSSFFCFRAASRAMMGSFGSLFAIVLMERCMAGEE